MRRLVLIHGRSQQRKNAADLKQEWVQALHKGLTGAGVSATIPEERVRFPYYGDTLNHLVEGLTDAAPDVIVKGYGDLAPGEEKFIAEVVGEAVQRLGLAEEDIRAVAGQPGVIQKGVRNWPWVLAALRAIDRSPGLASASLQLVTRDVYRYLHSIGIQTQIDDGVRKAITSDEEHVVVAHSLGSVVAYNVLKRDAEELNWKVPTLVTLGSPLAINPIAQKLRPVSRPHGVKIWFNAFDPQDIVALHPLDRERFPVTPEVENFSQIRNETSHHHGIIGYLQHPEVALRIYRALVQ
ncbi:hypothetical protein ABZ281_41105 [Streptomyces sp. NPDC006265]|uniref:hypothetical protein n=1 Tax=Streptomyces sp. NPDC006265 TaxID=3156740 RepID=UPI0033A739BB